MSEANFRKRIKEFSGPCGFDVHWQSIESSATGQGIPDLNGCCQGQDVWLELKYTEHLKTKNIGLKPPQIAWIYKRAKAGGNVWIALYMQTKKRDVGFIYLWQGKKVQKVAEHGTEFQPNLLLRVENKDDWIDFYSTIFNLAS
jgi:hypothetical protein